MNDKIAKQIEEMKKQTIGIEVEMNSITRQKAARVAAEFFGTGRYEYTAGRNGYETWSAWDEQGREWKMQKDVSIAMRMELHGVPNDVCNLVVPAVIHSLHRVQYASLYRFQAILDIRDGSLKNYV